MTGREPESQETVLEFLRRGRKGFYPSTIRTCEGDLFLMYIEQSNDEAKYPYKATQRDFDNF